MKIGIMSDTHDNTPVIDWIIEYMNQNNIKFAFHAGDMINPGILFRFRDHYQGHLHFVFGNNDGEKAYAQERANAADNLTCHKEVMEIDLHDKKIFMNHFSSVGERVAKSGDFDLCIGGHDHAYRVVKYDRGLFINPGNTVTKDKWLPQEADKESSFVIFNFETMEPERIEIPATLL